MTTQTRAATLLRRRGPRYYADLRGFWSLGGRFEALKPRGDRYATTDRDIAIKLLADRITELEQRKRDKVLLGREKTAPIAEYAAHHLRMKSKSGKVTAQTMQASEQRLRVFVEFIGPGKLLETITTVDMQMFAVHLSALPGLRGRTLSGQSVLHYLHAVSSLFRRAQAEGYVPAGYDPVAVMVDKPTAKRLEARWLEVHEAALFLESARLYESKRADLAVTFIHPLIATLLLTGGRWKEVAGLLVSDISLERSTVTFRPHEHRRLKTLTSFRTVPLHPQLREILETYLREHRRIGGLLFPSPRTGKMITDIRKSMDGIAETIGWGAGDIRTKMFRHTYCAARLQTLDAGYPIAVYTVARELGHGGDSLIKRVYGHLGTVRHRADHVEFRIEQHEDRDDVRDRLRRLRLA